MIRNALPRSRKRWKATQQPFESATGSCDAMATTDCPQTDPRDELHESREETGAPHCRQWRARLGRGFKRVRGWRCGLRPPRGPRAEGPPRLFASPRESFYVLASLKRTERVPASRARRVSIASQPVGGIVGAAIPGQLGGGKARKEDEESEDRVRDVQVTAVVGVGAPLAGEGQGLDPEQALEDCDGVGDVPPPVAVRVAAEKGEPRSGGQPPQFAPSDPSSAANQSAPSKDRNPAG